MIFAQAGEPDAGVAVPDDASIQWRLVLPMVNEAARCLEEDVTDSTDAIDLATVLGLGLAPFRGGLVQFANAVGAEEIVKRLYDLSARHGTTIRARRVPARTGDDASTDGAFRDDGSIDERKRAIEFDRVTAAAGAAAESSRVT
jgi:3-hydroxyacyl-CoA dehydrogenase